MEAVQKYLEKNLVAGLNYSRFLLYFAESIPLIQIRKLLDKNLSPADIPVDHAELLKTEIKDLIQKDMALINDSLVGLQQVLPQKPSKHLKTYAKLLVDAVGAGYRASKNENKKFSQKYTKELESLPEYYRRNFHYQTNGYLSEASAELYEHQTEILFRGTLNVMRRVLLRRALEMVKEKSINVLDVASGTGNLSELLIKTNPKTKMTAIDLSEAYLKKAKHKLASASHFTTIKEAAESFSGENNSFDLAVSGYLFHEIPKDTRLEVLKNIYRVLKPGGEFHIIDSLQWQDKPQFRWALEQFPKDFHEPYYKNYLMNPLQDLGLQAGFTVIEQSNAFLSKLVVLKKA